jgi:hypothetical protein
MQIPNPQSNKTPYRQPKQLRIIEHRSYSSLIIVITHLLNPYHAIARITPIPANHAKNGYEQQNPKPMIILINIQKILHSQPQITDPHLHLLHEPYLLMPKNPSASNKLPNEIAEPDTLIHGDHPPPDRPERVPRLKM